MPSHWQLPPGIYVQLHKTTLSIRRHNKTYLHQGTYSYDKHYNFLFDALLLNVSKHAYKPHPEYLIYWTKGKESNQYVRHIQMKQKQNKTY